MKRIIVRTKAAKVVKKTTNITSMVISAINFIQTTGGKNLSPLAVRGVIHQLYGNLMKETPHELLIARAMNDLKKGRGASVVSSR